MSPSETECTLVVKRIARCLADNDPKIRNKGMKKLRLWLGMQQKKKGDLLSPDNMLRLWRGLFFVVWMSDKPLRQEKLCESVASLIQVFQINQDAALFIKCFFETLAKEWAKIDKWRFEKFMMLVRRMLRYSLDWGKGQKGSWEKKELLKEVLSETVVKDEPAHLAKMPLGLKLHVADMFLEELAKVSGKDVKTEVVEAFVEPYFKVVSEGRDYRMVNHVIKRVFEYLILQSDVGLKYEAERQLGVTAEGSDEDEEDAEEGEEDEAATGGELDPRAGRVDVTLPQLQVNFENLAAKSFSLAQVPNIRQKNRKQLYRLHQMFEQVSRGVFPPGVRSAL